MAEVRTMDFFKCMNKRCQVNFWPAYVSDTCPVCGLSGFFAGMAVNQADIQRMPTDDEEGE